MLFTLFLVIFAAFAIWRTRQQFVARRVSKYWFALWTAFWLLVVVVALTPQTTDVIARVAGVGRGADLLVYIGVVVLSYAVYRLVVRQQRLEHDVTELVRAIAIHRAEKP